MNPKLISRLTFGLLFSSLIALSIVFTNCQEKAPQPESMDFTQFVDPFIGSGGEIGEGHGNVFPGATYPFGMIQLSPDNGGQGWEYCSGYHYPDSIIAGFSHTHLSGTGVGDLADISVMPTTKEIREEYFIQDEQYLDEWAKSQNITRESIQGNYLVKYRSHFSHVNEKAGPGYYSVLLDDDSISAELAVTEFVGWHRYTFPKTGKTQHLILDLGFSINRDKPVKTEIQILSDSLIVGCRFSTGWAADQKVYFAMGFSRPFHEKQYFASERIEGDSLAIGNNVKGVFSFTPDSGDTLLVKTAISSASIEGALLNLKMDDHLGWNFDATWQATKAKWNRELGKVKVKTDNQKTLILFYTSLYRSLLTPYRFSDTNGFYKGYSGNPVKTDKVQYTVLSLWDTFRGLKPLLTLLEPDVYNHIIHSMLAQYRQTGVLPYWELVGNEGGSMIGYHAVPVIADAIFKGIGDFDRQEAYEAMKATSHFDRKGLGLYRKYGFVPTDLDKSGTVSKTIEFAYDDWCIAQVAKKLGDQEGYDFYMRSAQNYKNVFDPAIKLMRGKNSDATWYSDFQPTFSEFGNPHFVEGNTWHYSFFVPHDVEGLIELMGGVEDFEMMLDSLFTQSSVQLGEDTEDVTGLIGQYAHGNEPSHHVAYLYNYIGKNHKTQYWVNEILHNLYDNTPAGLCGNEDCGQISAWYVWSSLGFYPVNPINGEYQIGSPQFSEVVMDIPGGKQFNIIAHNVSDKNIYIQQIRFNNMVWNSPFIRHSDIMNGGLLEFDMTDTPVDFSKR